MNQSMMTKCLALVGLCFYLIQIGVHSMALNQIEADCVRELNLNKSIIEAWNIEPLIPEDNAEVGIYMTCYWKKLGYQKDNGEIDYYKISEVVHSDLKSRFHGECVHIVAYVVDSCRNDVQADSDGLRAIRMWNCLNVYTENLF